MALVKCKECGNEMSTKAVACPKCGAAAAKKTSVMTWLLGGIFASAIVITLVGVANKDNARASSTPEQSAAIQKKELAFQTVVGFGQAVKSRMRDPSSLEWEVIAANEDASVICMQYRAKNGFGGFGREIVILANGKTSSETKAWKKHCGAGLNDFKHARMAI